MKLLGASAGLALGVWGYLLLARGRFWRNVPGKQTAPAEPNPSAEPVTPGTRGARPLPRVIAVVPARNEAAVVGECITSLLKQRGVEMRVVLVDDASSDNTAEIARRAATEYSSTECSVLSGLGSLVGEPPRGVLTVIRGSSLPPGWSGKLWALAQGVEHAASLWQSGVAGTGANTPDFLFFTDADIRHSPETVSALAQMAEREGASLASYMVKLSCRSVPERLLIPAFVFFFFMLYPPKWTADPNSRTAGAAGGSILIRPAALEAAGGIQAIRGEIIDDCALARAVKRTGGKVLLGLTHSSVSLREYGSFREIGHMIARTAFNQLNHSAALLVVSVAGLAITYLVPVGALFSGNRAASVAGAMACLSMACAYFPTVRFFGLNPAWALTLPAAASFYMGATVVSAIQYWSGHGGQWKGRAQDNKQLSRSQG
jgi:hopene-associated glycosyltransferase HpnB